MSKEDNTETVNKQTRTLNPWAMLFVGLIMGTLLEAALSPVSFAKNFFSKKPEVSLKQGELYSDCPAKHNVWLGIAQGTEPEAWAGCSFKSELKVEGNKGTFKCKQYKTVHTKQEPGESSVDKDDKSNNP